MGAATSTRPSCAVSDRKPHPRCQQINPMRSSGTQLSHVGKEREWMKFTNKPSSDVHATL